MENSLSGWPVDEESCKLLQALSGQMWLHTQRGFRWLCYDAEARRDRRWLLGRPLQHRAWGLFADFTGFPVAFGRDRSGICQQVWLCGRRNVPWAWQTMPRSAHRLVRWDDDALVVSFRFPWALWLLLTQAKGSWNPGLEFCFSFLIKLLCFDRFVSQW